MSRATNLAPGDGNNAWDVFVRDVAAGRTYRVSVDSFGAEANGISSCGGISGDGRLVAFWSWADNLVPGDTNAATDAFVHDRLTGATTRISVSSSGTQGSSNSDTMEMSSGGRFVAFGSYSNNLVPGDLNGEHDVFVHDLVTAQTVCVSVNPQGVPASGSASFPSISGDGRYVTFISSSTELVPGDTNGQIDVFVRDLLLGRTARVSVDSLGAQANSISYATAISDDGKHVAFVSAATNLVPGDTNGVEDIFVRDLASGQTTRASLRTGGGQVNGWSEGPSISADGRYVAFHSMATNAGCGGNNGVIDVFVHDRQLAVTECVSVEGVFRLPGDSVSPSISPDGRFIAFSSEAPNLVPGDNNGLEDVFLRDRGWNGPSLTKSGSCPGPVTLDVAGAGPGQAVLILSGPAGSFVHGGPRCTGLTLAISTPTRRAILTADATGAAQFQFNAPMGVCGVTVQAVDLWTCTPTNPVVL